MHVPVLLEEVLEIFQPHPGGRYIDATINGGGHARAILSKIGAGGALLGIDWDCELIDKLSKEKVSNLKLECENYANILSVIRKHNFLQIDGILFDLGFSAHHIEESKRGFSFLRNEPLDMRYNIYGDISTVEEIINTWPEAAIADTLRKFGNERFASRIARFLVGNRKKKRITKTGELVEIIRRAIPPRFRRGRIHLATKTFQALRIAANRELENLKEGLDQSFMALNTGGKIAIISFHSLEGRIIKEFFKEKKEAGRALILTPKAINPSSQEIRMNPRARSARLRALQRI